MTRTYRADIDGLRAIAVLAVILFHFHVSPFRGGYVGVDVFFVISGYLISSIILDELDKGAFSLIRFYERRARRILPALFAVCIGCFGAGLLFLFPAALTELGKSEAAAALSVSNIFFWSVTGYFETTVWEKPLLHTWSLGVEEQFYLLFPLMLMILHRLGRRWLLIGVAFSGALSLLASAVCIANWPEAVFYLLPFRFWELALGGLLALAPALPLRKFISILMTVAGVAAILAAAVLYRKQTVFPGLAALLPCLGAALVIAAGGRTAGWLAAKPVNLIGRMSYSLYLWHWPLQVFARIRFNDPLSAHGLEGWAWKTGLFALTFLLGYVSWRYIEQPVRRAALPRRRVLMGAGASMAAVAMLGAILAIGNGLPGRFPAQALSFATAQGAHAPVPGVDCRDADPAMADNSHCIIGDHTQVTITAVVWGDSHAATLAPAFDRLLDKRHTKAILIQHSGCAPYSDEAVENNGEFKDCAAFNRTALDYVVRHPDIKTVILAGRWATHKSMTFDGKKKDAFYRALEKNVSLLKRQGRSVLIVASLPEIDFNAPLCLARRAAFGEGVFSCSPPTLEYYENKQAATLPAFRRLETIAPLYYPHKTLCRDTSCFLQDGDTSLYADDNHPTVHGALFLYPDMERAFAPELDRAR